jgi:hypothetical protein
MCKGMTIAEVMTVECNGEVGVIEGFANARLIAAAPDLLAALSRIVNDSPEPGEDAVLTVEGYNQACAAIAKAMGHS